jgi:hypothetical protein
MKKVYSHENRLIVFNLKNLLEEQGIECMIKNEFSGGGVGDLAPLDTWPEVWINDDDLFDRAQALIKETLNNPSESDDWFCPDCGEKNAFSFQLCWNCQTERNSRP